MRDAVRGFLSSIRALDDNSGWLYFLDLLDLVEIHREGLRHAVWPSDFPELEIATYRGLLIVIEDKLRAAIQRMPLAKSEEEFREISDFLAGLLGTFTQRADAIVERLDPERKVQ
ncbi:MAG: hypothetical protein M3406_09090 [Chloroflexota bacterium]|nr:hypothetical protein [Chloroflexota bacterium]